MLAGVCSLDVGRVTTRVVTRLKNDVANRKRTHVSTWSGDCDYVKSCSAVSCRVCCEGPGAADHSAKAVRKLVVLFVEVTSTKRCRRCSGSRLKTSVLAFDAFFGSN